jgi:hypothetical protein
MQYELPPDQLELEAPEEQMGVVGRMSAMDEHMVGPMELEDLYGPEMGYENPAIAGAPDMGMGMEMPMDMGAQQPGMGQGMGPQMGNAAEQQDSIKNDARDMLSLRAQERLAASKSFQERAASMYRNMK